MTADYDPILTPWQVQERDFPREGSAAEKLEFLIRYAILAPSGHNSQPWKFSIGANEIQVIADKTRWSRAIDPRQRELHIAVGCALENLLVAAEHFGYGYRVIYFPKPDREELVASVQFLSQGSARSGAKDQPSPFRGPDLFGAMVARHTNRKEYQEQPLSKSDLSRLRNCCVEEGISLYITDDLEIKRQFKELLIRGHAATMTDAGFLKETGYWIRQGLFNMPPPLARLVQLAMTMPGLSAFGASALAKPLLALVDSRLVMSASAVAVLSSSVQGYESQVQVGQVFERISLAATVLGIRVHPMSPITSVPELKAQVAKLLPTLDVIPQHAFRLGYAEQVKTPAQRRPLAQAIV